MCLDFIHAFHIHCSTVEVPSSWYIIVFIYVNLIWMSLWIIQPSGKVKSEKDTEEGRWKSLSGEVNKWNLLFICHMIRFLKIYPYFCSQGTHTGAFVPRGPQCLHKARQKRKRTCHKRQYLTYVSARTRPLLTYHKPRLFIMDPVSHREQVGILKPNSSRYIIAYSTVQRFGVCMIYVFERSL